MATQRTAHVQALKVLCPLAGAGELWVPLPVAGGLAGLRQLVEGHFGQSLPVKDYVLTDTQKDVTSDADLEQLRDGATVVAVSGEDRTLVLPVRERISFQPHPKTLTMAGDFEYFAAQGRHPFVFALAEFVDNSLRATRKNAPRPRSITVSLMLSGSNPSTAKGLVCVADNGCGMSKQELNEWAVMNYTMEERGKAPQEPEVQGRGGGGGAGRFLTGDLSFFGVGSKNACFFMGSTIKITTKRAEEAYVHELGLAADVLEQRYRNQESVYEDDMIHRNPGDPSTLSPVEQPFASARAWVQQEAEAVAAGDASFTRVLIGDLKPDVLSLIMEDEQGTHICQELAHLYHYYLHGEGGNRAGKQPEGRLPNGEPFPDITVQYLVDSRVVWSRRLVEVDDDMETRYLRAQKSELAFTLDVPGKGTVCGVLHYFPFENDHETVPLENAACNAKPLNGCSPLRGLTQVGPSQLPPRATQHPHMTQQPRVGGESTVAGDSDDEEDADVTPWQAPIFEAFWQGRLIPGARIETLPFMEAVRQKRNAQTKDIVPDEAFRRLRGALFFGPAFRVTRNKLLFRDNLQELLATAVPGDRGMERKFKEWLARCHATLDKTIRFEALADSRAQATFRSRLGESTTAFERITDGSRTVSVGDAVRINVKPILVGRVTAFTISQAVREEGCYPSGRVHVEVLPAEVHGQGCRRDFSLRRIDCVLGEKELKEHISKELLKVPSCLRLVEPHRLATGKVFEFAAGDALPETRLSVLNGAGQKMTRGQFGGERAALVVIQRLWRLADGADAEFAPMPVPAPAAEAAQDLAEEDAAVARPVKRARKGRKGKAQAAKQDENADPAAAAAAAPKAALPPGQELVLCVENKTPNKECFQFARVSDGLQRAGQYALEYTLAPSAPGQVRRISPKEPLSLVVRLLVRPGPPVRLSLSGEGKAVAALRELALGEELPPLKLALQDEFGNPLLLEGPAAAEPPPLSIFAAAPDDSGQLVPCRELEVAAAQGAEGSCIVLSGIRVTGCEEARGIKQGLQLFSKPPYATRTTAPQAQLPPSQQSVSSTEVMICIQTGAEQGGAQWEPEMLPIKLRPGAPQSLHLLPGHPWEAEGGAGDDGSLPALSLQSGQELPPFKVAAFDSWGNPTAPSESLGFSLRLKCPATTPSKLECQFTNLGVATVEGLVAQQGSGGEGLRLALKCAPANAGAEAAVTVAQPLQELRLPLRVEVSMVPTAIQLLWKDEVLDAGPPQGDARWPICCMRGMEAGAPVGGLRLVLLDEVGQVSRQAVEGRITASWRKGCKRVSWDGQPIKLPSMPAPEKVCEPATVWVRFQSDVPPLMLETGLELHAAPAAPCAWKGTIDHDANPAVQSQGPGGRMTVQCGESFVLTVEAVDAFDNRCPGGAAALIPPPLVTVAAACPLESGEQEWERGWVTQGGEEVYSVRMRLRGELGPVDIHIADAGGEDGASALLPDDLHVDLVPGPPTNLCIDGAEAAPQRCGLRAVLHQVCVRVCDAAGNPIACPGALEVSLSNSALAVDGSGAAASVSVPGGNKAKAKAGLAVFKDVRVAAEQAGTYALRAQSASRKLALQDGALQLAMAPQNVVTSVGVLVPEHLQEGCLAGCPAELHVMLETEDGAALPQDAASGGLSLKVTPPGGQSTMVLSWSPDGEGRLGASTFSFPLGELTAAGTYAAVAEYTESRAGVLAGLSKKEAALRSSTVQLHVLPGQPVTLSLEVPGLRDKLTATNGQAARQRLLIQNAAVQLRDAYGNAARGRGVQVRFRLQGGAGGEAPQLEDAAGQGGGELVRETDEQGRAFFGDLLLAQGSGRASSSGSLECRLVCEGLGLYPSDSVELEVDEDGWALCWDCALLFSDDAARYAALEQLNSRRGQLAAEREELQGRLQQAQQSVDAAVREQQRLAKSLVSKGKALPGGPPACVEEARERMGQLAQEQERAAEAAAAPVRPAKYGPPRQGTTHAINKILQTGDEGVVGVVARLATLDDEHLARIVSAQYRSLLPVVVVQDMPCRERVVRLVQEGKLPVPDIIPLSQSVPYRGPTEGEVPGFAGAGPLAKRLLQAACVGTDGPVPTPLPHARVLANSRERGDRHELGVDDWPAGCLGYAYNLLRPVVRGHRAGILVNLMGQTLVFETLQQAAAYREFMTQKLRTGLSDIICLDGNRITGRGIVSGSSFQPPQLDKADYCFGATPHGQNQALAGAAAELEALQAWAELAENKAAADGGVEEARGAAEAVAAEVEGQVAALERELVALDEQLAQQGPQQEAAAGKLAKRGKRQNADRGSKSPFGAAPEAGDAQEENDNGDGNRSKRRRTQRNR